MNVFCYLCLLYFCVFFLLSNTTVIADDSLAKNLSNFKEKVATIELEQLKKQIKRLIFANTFNDSRAFQYRRLNNKKAFYRIKLVKQYNDKQLATMLAKVKTKPTGLQFVATLPQTKIDALYMNYKILLSVLARLDNKIFRDKVNFQVAKKFSVNEDKGKDDSSKSTNILTPSLFKAIKLARYGNNNSQQTSLADYKKELQHAENQKVIYNSLIIRNIKELKQHISKLADNQPEQQKQTNKQNQKNTKSITSLAMLEKVMAEDKRKMHYRLYRQIYTSIALGNYSIELYKILANNKELYRATLSRRYANQRLASLVKNTLKKDPKYLTTVTDIQKETHFNHFTWLLKTKQATEKKIIATKINIKKTEAEIADYHARKASEKTSKKNKNSNREGRRDKNKEDVKLARYKEKVTRLQKSLVQLQETIQTIDIVSNANMATLQKYMQQEKQQNKISNEHTTTAVN